MEASIDYAAWSQCRKARNFREVVLKKLDFRITGMLNGCSISLSGWIGIVCVEHIESGRSSSRTSSSVRVQRNW